MLKRRLIRFICMLALAVFTVSAACAEGMIVINEGLPSLSQEETLEMLSEVTEEYLGNPDIAAELEQEIGMRQISDHFDEDERKFISLGTVVHDGHTMQFLMDIIGGAGREREISTVYRAARRRRVRTGKQRQPVVYDV